MTTKPSGAPCPDCREQSCAEYAAKGEPPKWTCHACHASGFLTGAFIGRERAPALKPAPKKHWRDRR